MNRVFQGLTSASMEQEGGYQEKYIPSLIVLIIAADLQCDKRPSGTRLIVTSELPLKFHDFVMTRENTLYYE